LEFQCVTCANFGIVLQSWFFNASCDGQPVAVSVRQMFGLWGEYLDRLT